MGIPYLGMYPSDPRDLVDVGYINDQIAALNLSEGAVTSLISSGLAGYADKSYVDSQNLLNATQAYVDNGDATRLHLSQIGANSGVVGLNSLGVVDLSRLNLTVNQKFPLPFTSPSTYFSSAFAATTEAQIYPAVTVNDPGYPYRLMVFGLVDAKTNTDGEYPIVRVRAGAVNGPIVAFGYGNAEHYGYINQTIYNVAGSYSLIPQSTSVRIVALGAGGGGGQGGTGGKAGAWAGADYTLPPGEQLNILVGAGGPGAAVNSGTPPPPSPGGATSVSGTGMTTLTAAGGAAGTSSTGTATAGASPPPFTLDDETYTGGVGGAKGSSSYPYGSDGGTGAGGGGGIRTGDGFFTGFTWYSGGSGGDGAVEVTELIPPGSTDPDNAAPVDIIPVAMDLQTVLTGSTQLFVNLVRSGTSSTVTANPFKPNLWIMPVPA